MTVTDILTLILSIVFLMVGASRGFLQSLMGPVAMIVATIISIIYYQCTANIVVSLLIGLLGPILISLILKFLLRTWTVVTNSDIKPDALSAMAGAVLTFIWGWIFIIFTLILLTVLPLWGDAFTAIHRDVAKSSSYAMASHVEDRLFSGSKQNVTAVASVASAADAKSLAQDPRFQAVLQDPDIQKDIEAHDIVKLMRNPKMMKLVQQLMSDPVAMKKLMALYRTQSQQQPIKNP